MKPTQHEGELSAFVQLVRANGCSSYLEIGSKAGRSLEAVASALRQPSKIVGVDLPKPERDVARQMLNDVLMVLSGHHDVSLVLGSSGDAETVATVSGRGPFDLVFIDADHSEKAVRADWSSYGPMGRLVAFHDIADTGLGVRAVWEELKPQYRHVEIKLDPRGNRNGIGVLWRCT